MLRQIALFTVFSAFPAFIFGQNRADSMPPLRAERLLEADILGRSELSKKSEVVSATRSAIDLDAQPFTMFVVTAEEISRNNFVTLADVLRTVPGIRVSQPGSGLDGETFLMRGLRGNGYVKILINDVPIKPSATSGLPIGAQLPIRQAERIEILYGPAAAIYGGDACAGVINIILRETERPLFNQASLSFGNFSFNALDLFFGGKLGRDRNIFRFSIYGSSTVQDDRGLFSNDVAQFDAKKYLFEPKDDFAWKAAKNYRPYNQDRQNPSSTPQFSNTPHESRLFGLNLTWRGIHFTYHRMLRRDHSSLGLSPLEVGYSNPQSILGERIETFSIGARRQKTRSGIDYNLSVVRFRMENRSNFTFIRPVLNEAFLRARGWPDTFASNTTVLNFQYDLERQYFDNERYTRASSTDFRQEIRGSWHFRGGWHCDAGNVLTLQSATPLALFLPAPFDRQSSEDRSPIRPLSVLDLSTNLYSQLIWQRKRFFGLVGVSGNLEPSGKNGSARVAFRAKINRWASLRGVFAEGYRQPSPFYRANTFLIDPVGSRADVRTQHFALEKTRSMEFGGSVLMGKVGKLDAVVFLSSTENVLTNGHFYLFKDEFAIEKAYFGWRGNGYLQARGLQFSYFSKENKADELEFFGRVWLKKTAASHRLSWVLTKSRFEDLANQNGPLGSPGQPKSILRWQWQARAGSWEVLGRHNWESSAPTTQNWWQERWGRAENRERTPRFSTFDFSIRLFLSKNFKIYGEAINLFDSEFFGLDATGSPQDLLANPQTGRQLRLGIHYDMN